MADGSLTTSEDLNGVGVISKAGRQSSSAVKRCRDKFLCDRDRSEQLNHQQCQQLLHKPFRGWWRAGIFGTCLHRALIYR